MKGYYQIQEVAALYSLHPDTLRYYEEQGLITPGRGENNYRLYSIREICDLNIIQNLRSLDVPVAKIRDYLTTRTVCSTLELLREEQALIDERIAALEALREAVQRRTRDLLEARGLAVGEPRLLTLPERRCYRLSEGVTMEKDVDILLKRLEKRHEKRLRTVGERQMGAALDTKWMKKGFFNRYSHAFFICEGIEDHDDILPAGLYATMLYAGEYDHIRQALPELLEFVKRRRLMAVSAPMELYRIDIHDTGRTEEFRTELQIKVSTRESGETTLQQLV